MIFQKCVPPFENAVAGKMVFVTPENKTCGLKGRTDYCIQTHGISKECDFCDGNDPDRMHPATYLTDVHSETSKTWWQSVTMLEGVHLQDVNLTVNLGK